MNSARAFKMVAMATRATSTTNIAALILKQAILLNMFIHCNAYAQFRDLVATKIWFLLKPPFYTLLQCYNNVRRAEQNLTNDPNKSWTCECDLEKLT